METNTFDTKFVQGKLFPSTKHQNNTMARYSNVQNLDLKKKKLKRKNKNENCLTLHGLEIFMIAWVLKKSSIFHLWTFGGIMYLWFSFCLDQWAPKKKKTSNNLHYATLTQKPTPTHIQAHITTSSHRLRLSIESYDSYGHQATSERALSLIENILGM